MILIYKTLIIPVKTNKTDYEYLISLNKLSATVWNKCVELNDEYKKKYDKWISRNELQKLTKNMVNLTAKNIQHIIGKYLYARSAIFQARKAGRHDELYPYKKKKYFTTGWDSQSIRVKDNKLLLSRPMTKEKIDGKYRKQKPVVCHVKNLPKNIVEVELIYRDKYYLAIKFKEESNHLQIKSNNSAAIDLGEIHAITSIDSSGNAIIITGRKLRSIKQLRNKTQAKLYYKLSKTTKGSNNYWKYRNALKKLKFSTENKINDAVHKITKHYVDYCLMNNISTVYYGDLDSATRSTKEKKKGNKMVRQKLSQWNYGQITKQLENKLNRYGIEMIKVKEYYTSQKCPNCDKLNKPKGREYKCSCGYHQHRDIVGAINILNDNTGTKLTHYTSKKYLRIE